MLQSNSISLPSVIANSADAAQHELQRRVLIIAYTHYIFDARVKRHAEALAQQGYAVDVLCLANGHETHRSVEIIGIPLSRYRGHSRAQYIRQYVSFFAQAAWTAARLNRAHRYDVVIVCSIPDAAVLAGLLPKWSGSKLVLDMHDTMPELYREKFPGKLGAIGAAVLKGQERASAWLADMVFAVHAPHAARLQQSGIPRDKIIVLLNAPDPRLFQPLQHRDDSCADRFTVVTHGTINRRLGLDTAIEAINLVRERIPNLRFRIIGPGEHRQSVQRHAWQRHLDSIIQFEDGVPLEGLATALRGAAVGLVPNEATAATQLMLPVKLLEYVCLGIPVIASRLRTISHYFPEDALRYFEPADPQSLAESLLDLHSHPEKLQALAGRAREAAKRISWEMQQQTLYKAIERLLASAPPRTRSVPASHPDSASKEFGPKLV
jgi:glycosyltransferase involved in cell wall biosynthesis